MEILICPNCRSSLDRPQPSRLSCHQCGKHYPIDDEIADFAEGSYYDELPPEGILSEAQQQGLDNEIQGTVARIRDFYGPLLESRRRGKADSSGPFRVLDSGCGNGLSIDLLNEAGFEAWGNDISALRKWQWRQRSRRDRLVVADTRRLPFPDGFFDAVISSGVIEHIGVHETGGETYTVEPLPEKDAARAAFLGELLRVVAPSGRLYVDCPNGAFPIDFWHGPRAGNARFHSLDEGFLPHAREIRKIVGGLGEWSLQTLSPYKRLQMLQVGGHWYGKLFRWPMMLVLRAMKLPGVGPLLAGSPINPYLVMEIRTA